MKELFVPQEIENGRFEELMKPIEQEQLEDYVIVLAAKRNIYVLPDMHDDELINICTRDQDVSSLCYHKGKIYDASYKEIRETISGVLVKTREQRINAMCSYEDEIYSGGEWNNILATFTENAISSHKGSITAMASDDKHLYYAFKSDNNSYLKRKPSQWYGGDQLYDTESTIKDICLRFDSIYLITKPPSDRTQILRLNIGGISRIDTNDIVLSSICTHEEQICYAHQGGLFNAITKKQGPTFAFTPSSHSPINAMISVPKSALEGLI